MANTFIYTDGGASDHTIYTGDGSDTNIHVLQGSEFGIEDTANLVGELTPDRLADQYRGTIYQPREYGFRVLLKYDSIANLETGLTNWRTWHNRELGEGHIKRVTPGGLTKELDCIPLETRIISRGVVTAEIEQTYRAYNPWWRSETATLVEAALNGTNNVNFSCANTGQIPAWPVITVTGVFATSVKFTNTSGDYIQVNFANTNADDVLTIDCRPRGTYRRSVYYLEHGAGTPAYKPITSASQYVTLPVATANLVGVLGGAGTPDVDVSFYLYYGGLY